MLIAWEMGLGKTVLALAIAEELLTLDVTMNMIVASSSLKYQWAKELVKFTDVDTREIKLGGQSIVVPTEEYCIIVDGPPEVRARKYEQIIETRPDYVILSYENVLNDWKYVRRLNPECIFADEVTAVKSFKAQRTRKIKRLTAKYRFGLTGTPVENGKPEEIFSIMQWVDGEVFGRYDIFDKTFIKRNNFGGVENYKNLPLFHATLSQAMVRRTRLDSDVRPYMPEVEEQTKYVELDSRTAKVYKLISKDLSAELFKLDPRTLQFDINAHYQGNSNMDSAVGKVMSKLSALNMLCDHPELLRVSAKRYENGEGEGSKYCWQLVNSGALDGLTHSPKMSAHVARLQSLLESNPANKIIVFSFYPEMARLIANEMTCDFVFYNGSMNAKEKAAAKERFEKDANCRIFFSSDAGGFGVNLFMANYLFNYDLPSSAGKSDQRNARHVRLSSLFDNVFIVNEIIKGSIEERDLQRLEFKRRVGRAITDGVGHDIRGRIDNDVSSLTAWLKEKSV